MHKPCVFSEFEDLLLVLPTLSSWTHLMPSRESNVCVNKTIQYIKRDKHAYLVHHKRIISGRVDSMNILACLYRKERRECKNEWEGWIRKTLPSSFFFVVHLLLCCVQIEDGRNLHVSTGNEGEFEDWLEGWIWSKLPSSFFFVVYLLRFCVHTEETWMFLEESERVLDTYVSLCVVTHLVLAAQRRA